MGRRMCWWLSVLVCCACLILPVSAQTYVDDMVDLDNNLLKSYTNLAPFSMDANSWSGVPDRTVFGFASLGHLSAEASYRISGASHITVGFYTNYGSFVSQQADGTYAVGMSANSVGAVGKRLDQCLYSPSTRGVYAKIEGQTHRAYAANQGHLFVLDSDAPSDLVGYAINVYASGDGQRYSAVSLRSTRWDSDTDNLRLCYEELSGSLPAGTRFIRVELNDSAQTPLLHQPGGYETKTNRRLNLLASVSFSGSKLVLGMDPPLVSEDPGPAPPASQSSQSSRVQQSQSAGAVAGGGGGGGTSVSKFEGVIESSAKSSSTTAGRTSSAPSSSRKESSSPVPSQFSSTTPANPDAVFLVPPHSTGGSDGFTVGVTIYIIIVVGCLLFILLNSHLKKGS